MFERFRWGGMRGNVPTVVPAVILEADTTVSVAAADGGFVEHVEVLNPSVFLAVQSDKIREQVARGQRQPAALLVCFWWFHRFLVCRSSLSAAVPQLGVRRMKCRLVDNDMRRTGFEPAQTTFTLGDGLVPDRATYSDSAQNCFLVWEKFHFIHTIPQRLTPLHSAHTCTRTGSRSSQGKPSRFSRISRSGSLPFRARLPGRSRIQTTANKAMQENTLPRQRLVWFS